MSGTDLAGKRAACIESDEWRLRLRYTRRPCELDRVEFCCERECDGVSGVAYGTGAQAGASLRNRKLNPISPQSQAWYKSVHGRQARTLNCECGAHGSRA